MNINLNIPDYDGNALDVIWEQNSKYSIQIDKNNVVLRANKEGLESLGKQLIYMAFNDLPHGSHVHLDSFFTQKKDGENELIIEKDDHI